MTITIEAGKCYRTRDGCKVGPMEKSSHTLWTCADRNLLLGGDQPAFLPNGRYAGSSNGPGYNFDLIAEWTDTPEQPGPVVTETITRKRIVPGVYGKVSVNELDRDSMDVRWFAFVMGDHHKRKTVHAQMTADDLTAAIATLTAIRDAMQEAKP